LQDRVDKKYLKCSSSETYSSIDKIYQDEQLKKGHWSRVVDHFCANWIVKSLKRRREIAVPSILWYRYYCITVVLRTQYYR